MDEKAREAILLEIRDKVTRIEVQFIDLKTRVETIEENQRWLWRTFIASIVTAFITIIIKSKGM